MNRDKKIRFGLCLFFCSITLITLVKGTYAYPTTMESNNDKGNIVPLGGDGGTQKCWYCESNKEYRYEGSSEYEPRDDCSSGWTSCPTSTTPTPTITPTPSSSTIKPSPTSTTITINPPDPSPVYNEACYVCSTDNTNYFWGLRPSIGDYSCNSTWALTDKSENECKIETTPIETPTEENACYICSTDNTNYYWGLKPKDQTNSCDSSWILTNKSENECKIETTPIETPIEENACYICSTDNTNYYWGLKPNDGTNSCNSNWLVTSNSYNECKVHEEISSNPNTGDILLYIAYMVGISALVYSGLNFYKYKKNTK